MMVATPNLFYDYNFVTGSNPTQDHGVEVVPDTGGTPASLGEDETHGFFYGLAIDSAAGVYFVTSIQGADSYIYEEHFGLAPQFTSPLGGGPIATSLSAQVSSLALNASDDILYFTSGAGFYEETFIGANFSGTPTLTKLATLPVSTAATDDQIVFAPAHDGVAGSAYIAAPFAAHPPNFTTNPAGTAIITTGGWTKNFIYKVSDITPGAGAGTLTSQVSAINLGGPGGELPLSDGVISGVALGTDTLYIITRPGTAPKSTDAEGLYAYKISTGALTTIWSQTDAGGSTNVLNDMTYITVDPTTGEYFITDGALSKAPGIYTGFVNQSGVVPTTRLASFGEGSGDSTTALALDAPPTVAGDAVTAIDGATNHTTGTVTTADTVTITVTFSQNIFVTGASPTLTLNDGGVASFVGGSGTSALNFNYTPTSGQNTSTLAVTGVSGGTFTDSAGTAADLSNIAQNLAGLRVQTTPPSLSLTGETADFVQDATTPTTLLSSDTILDPAGAGQIVKATISIANAQPGDALSLPGLTGGTADNGAIMVTGVGGSTMTLTGAASLAEYESLLASVTYQDTGSDTTTQGHPTRTVDWTVDDGVLSSALATTTVTIDRPPTLAAGATAIYTVQGPPTTLDPGLSVTDLDGADITGATVTIASGYVAGDTFSFTNQNGVSGTQSGDQLVLTGAADAANYQSALESVAYSFSPANGDPTAGGTDTVRAIGWSVTDGVTPAATATSTLAIVPCFVRGARVLTARGEVAVEDLVVGDLAVTATGRRRPIVWIGHRGLDLTRHPDPAAVQPVRVRAGAFGEGLPRRDLWLSPGHNLACEGALIAAGLLVNGVSVEQIKQDRVEYWHVELDAHDVLLAEGLPVESYLDTGNRTAFANGGAFVEAHPDFAPRHWADTYLPLVHEGSPVVATRARLLARLAEQGCEVTQEADAHVRFDGLRVEPIRLSQTRLAFALPAGGREIALRSRVFVPAHTLADSTDPRALGLCVGTLQIDGSPFALGDDEACGPGWRQAEYEGGIFSHRWTTGEAALPAGARLVIVDLAGAGYYWAETETRVTGQARLCDRPSPSRMGS